MANLLVLSAAYPQAQSQSMQFVHNRNLIYLANGHQVTVINFSATNCYNHEGIEVITFDAYKQTEKNYDMAILHAPNLRNHAKFLYQFSHRFSKLCFFFHGHEVLPINVIYPPDYAFVAKKNPIKLFAQNVYDKTKLAYWRHALDKLAPKSSFVFVSQWMDDMFFKHVRIDRKKLEGRCHIIYNGINPAFENVVHNPCANPYNYLTLRSNLDGAKYAIDVVLRFALNNPNERFLIVGKGEFFTHHQLPDNVTWQNRTLPPQEIPALLNQAEIALMPTRLDAQGLMMCEMAATGMPVITSDIPVCHEVLGDLENVRLISNDSNGVELASLRESLLQNAPYPSNNTYTISNTVAKELTLLDTILQA